MFLRCVEILLRLLGGGVSIGFILVPQAGVGCVIFFGVGAVSGVILGVRLGEEFSFLG